MGIRYQQPQGSVHLSGSKFASSLTVLVLPPLGVVDLVSGRRFTNSPSTTPCVDGVGITADMASAVNLTVSVTSYPYAILSRQRRIGVSRNNWVGLSSTSSNLSYSFVRDDSSLSATTSNSSSGEDSIATDNVDGISTVLYVCNSSTDRRVYKNGVLIGSSSVSRVITDTLDRLNFGGLERTGGSWIPRDTTNLSICALSQGLFIDDALGVSITRNPWQIFRKNTSSVLLKTTSGGSTSGNASGSLPNIILNAIIGSASGGALASGGFSAVVLSAITGTASAGTVATAIGGMPTIQLMTASGAASGGALATGGNTTITLSPITGVGVAGGATAIGTLAAIYLAAPIGYATSGSTATGSLPSIQLSPISGVAYSVLSNSALPKYTVKSSSRNYSITHIRGSYVSTKKRP